MRRFPRELLLALLIAFVHGALYIVIVPRWQHYDEPTHFEYAGLIARRGTLPQPYDYDPDLRRAIARSMIGAGFYRDIGPPPNVDDPSAPPPFIGYSQLSDPPAYYVLPAAAQWMLRARPIETQLLAARVISLGLLLATVACAWGIAATLTPPGHALRWLLPCALALLPAFVDLMTSVNSDVAAVACFSFFLWGALRLMRGGGWLNALWTIGAAVLCALVKSATALALPLAALALLFAVLRGRGRWLAWAGLGTAAAVALFLAFGWGDPAGWYRNTSGDAPMRCAGRACLAPPPDGTHAFALAARSEAPPSLSHLLDPAQVQAARGQTVTLGAWLWADADGAANMPSLVLRVEDQRDVPVTFAASVPVTREPARHEITAVVPALASYGAIQLAPNATGSTGGAPTVFYDGISLTTPDGRDLVRNGSAEAAWPWMREPVQRAVFAVFPNRFTYNYLLSPLDPGGAGWYYAFTGELLFESFWARFAWGQVRAPAPVYPLLVLLCAISVIVTAVTWPRWRRWLRAEEAVLLAAAALALWTFTFVRGTPFLEVWPFLTVARYAYPAIIPTLLILLLGWGEVATALRARTRDDARGWRLFVGGAAALALGLALASLASVVRFFR